MPVRHRKIASGLFFAWVSGLFVGGLAAEPVYTPAGYGSGESLESVGWGVGTGYSTINDDIYITVSPTFELPLLMFRVGLQVPLEVLVLDREPKTGEKVPSIRAGTYDGWDDYLKLVQYVKYGTHLYYDPDDTFNWSFHYGKLNDGWLGHKTVVYRYVNNYDPTIFRAGLMADINNNWGGVEYFASDIWRREAVGWRGYVRPWGVISGFHDLFLVRNSLPAARQVAMSIRESHDPAIQRGTYYQARIPEHGEGGSIGQHFHGNIGTEAEQLENTDVRFEEFRDPETGQTQVRAVPVPPGQADEEDDDGGEEWGPSFWNRFAIGYFFVQDVDAPLDLERDGSGNLVVDPETLRPRSDTTETLTISGWDAEFRLSPFTFLELTPYVDFPRVEHLEGSKATHAGIDAGFTFGTFKITVRPEYREHASNYIPVYFDQYHVIERTIYNPGGSGDSTEGAGSNNVTKLAYLQSLPEDGEMVKGYFAQVLLEWVQNFVVDATYEDYDGLDNSRIYVGLYVPAVADVFLNGYYTKKNYDDIRESFEYDDRSLAALQVGYLLFGGMSITVEFKRTWEYDSTTSSYVPNDEITYGLGYSAVF
ncbi:MAG: hypothetical protein H7A21_17685 [Spirochaetales bacterium]|nr:hypothetical protein [Leptospiraceae bacterium]MCP5483272.1 hypothetical protein [Spirochaetales bacterium]